jgi:peptidylprolyl isomerase
MAKAKPGDTVLLLYVGTLDDGKVFDSSEMHGNKALQITLGSGKVLPGFEQAIIGMKPNQTKIIHIPAEQAYGLQRKELIDTIKSSEYPRGYKPEIGDSFDVPLKTGGSTKATVVEVFKDGLKIDANHPLAGKDLNFEIKLMEIL